MTFSPIYQGLKTYFTLAVIIDQDTLPETQKNSINFNEHISFEGFISSKEHLDNHIVWDAITATVDSKMNLLVVRTKYVAKLYPGSNIKLDDPAFNQKVKVNHSPYECLIDQKMLSLFLDMLSQSKDLSKSHQTMMLDKRNKQENIHELNQQILQNNNKSIEVHEKIYHLLTEEFALKGIDRQSNSQAAKNHLTLTQSRTGLSRLRTSSVPLTISSRQNWQNSTPSGDS